MNGTWQNFANNQGAAVTTWNYDFCRGWLTNKAHADGKGPVYANTPAGRLLTRTWARTVGGQPLVTTYGYNEVGDVQTLTYSDGTPGVTNTFDRRGRQKTISSSGMTTSLAYNDASQLLSESYSGGPLSGLIVSNRYDALMRRTTNGVWSGSAWLAQSRYGYDAASRLLTAGDGTSTAGYSYLANSPLVEKIGFTNNGVARMTSSKQYDHLNRLTAISSASASGVVSFAYQYNNANQRTRSTLADRSYWAYEYDTLGQVKRGARYWSDGTPVAGQQFEYGFDDIGNRTQTKSGGDENGANLRAASYTNNALNQITGRGVPGYVDVLGVALATNSVTVNGQTAYRKGEYFRKELAVNNGSSALWTNITVASGGTNVSGNRFVAKVAEGFGYDADGNLTNDGRWVFTWDAENRLTQVESLASGPTASKWRVAWEYDAQGRRVRQTIHDLSNGDIVTEDLKFLSDGWRHVAEMNATNNALVRTYLWGLDLSGSMDGAGGVGGLVMVNSAANGSHFYAYDGNGNVVALVKTTDGTESANYEYGPFGETVRVTGAMAKENPFRFSTKRTDNTTDFVLYECRIYSPSAGRWLSRDPIAEIPNDSGRNVYSFVENDSLSKVDPFGLWASAIHHEIIHQWLDQKQAEFIPESYKHFYWHCIPLDIESLLGEGNDEVDGNNFCGLLAAQSSANSYQHAMRAPWQTVPTAASKYHIFIEAQVYTATYMAARARAYIASGDTMSAKVAIKTAVQYIGRAQHPFADSSSPAHANFAVWYGPEIGLIEMTPIGYAIYLQNHKSKESRLSTETVNEVVAFYHQLLKSVLTQ